MTVPSASRGPTAERAGFSAVLSRNHPPCRPPTDLDTARKGGCRIPLVLGILLPSLACQAPIAAECDGAGDPLEGDAACEEAGDACAADAVPSEDSWFHATCDPPREGDWAYDVLCPPVAWGRFFPGSLWLSPDGRHLFYQVTFLPAPVPACWTERGYGAEYWGPVNVTDSYTATYRMNLEDFSIVPFGRVAGPPLMCTDMVEMLQGGGVDSASFWPCIESADGRYVAKLTTSDVDFCRGGWCTANRFPTACAQAQEPYTPEGVVMTVGILHDMTRRDSTWDWGGADGTAIQLLHWWNEWTWRWFPERVPCASQDAVYPGLHPGVPGCLYGAEPAVNNYMGLPCCRCNSDADCAAVGPVPEEHLCTGETADGIRYCVSLR